MDKIIYDICLKYNSPIWIFLVSTGIIIGLIGVFYRYVNLKNTLIKTKLMVEYEQIKLQYPDDVTVQLNEILKLYKQNGYKHVLSIILNIITIVLNTFVFISLMSIWNSAEIDYNLLNCSFLWMDNIFNKTSLICLALIITILFCLSNNIGKKITKQNILTLITSLITQFLAMMLYGLLFSTTYLLFLIGSYSVRVIFSILTINLKKEITKYTIENNKKLDELGLKNTSSESKKQAYNILKNEINTFVEGEKKAED